MCAIPQPGEDWPCDAMYHEDEESGMLCLIFERDLTDHERQTVRAGITGNSHWADSHTLILIRTETD